MISVRCKDNHQAAAIEALRRAKFKFPGRQKVHSAFCVGRGARVGRHVGVSVCFDLNKKDDFVRSFVCTPACLWMNGWMLCQCG